MLKQIETEREKLLADVAEKQKTLEAERAAWEDEQRRMRRAMASSSSSGYEEEVIKLDVGGVKLKTTRATLRCY